MTTLTASTAVRRQLPDDVVRAMVQIRHKVTGAVLLEVEGDSLANRPLVAKKLMGANLAGLDLSGSNLSNSDLRETDMTGATLERTIPQRRRLERRRLESCQPYGRRLYRFAPGRR
jgi:uncharacterized protein YjbI with pentapeptide repeats